MGTAYNFKPPFLFIDDKGWSVYNTREEALAALHADNNSSDIDDLVGKQWMICDSEGIACSWCACKGYEELDRITDAVLVEWAKISTIQAVMPITGAALVEWSKQHDTNS